MEINQVVARILIRKRLCLHAEYGMSKIMLTVKNKTTCYFNIFLTSQLKGSLLRHDGNYRFLALPEVPVRGITIIRFKKTLDCYERHSDHYR